MAFDGLEERFLANANQIYSKYSARVNKDGTLNEEPYIEVKPDDEDKVDLGQQTRSVPNVSIEVDTRRLTAFSNSPRGLQWYSNQAILQTGNTFAETRELNPDFILGNVDPFLHLQRPDDYASNIRPPDNGFIPSPVLRSNVGGAGRLQKHTSDRTVGIVVEGEGTNFYQILTRKLPIARIGGFLSRLAYGRPGEILGVNQRPELDMDGTGLYNSYYSVQVWLGFQKDDDRLLNVERIADNIRRGNLLGAIRAIGRTITDATGTFDNIRAGRIEAGKRYFITGPETATRYLADTVDFTPEGPRVNLRLGSQPIPVNKITSILDIGGIPSLLQGALDRRDPRGRFDIIETSTSRVRSFLNRVTRGIDTVTRFASQISAQNAGRLIQNELMRRLRDGTLPTFEPEIGAAEEKMLEEGRYSIRANYQNDEKWERLRENIKLQSDFWKASTRQSLESANEHGYMGYRGGVRVGEDITKGDLSSTGGRYLTDPVNLHEIARLPGRDHISSDVITLDRENAPTLVDFYFFDYINQVYVPLRANLVSFSESSQPEYHENRYIGRNERNIVYTGASRTAQFSFKIHAFSEEELVHVWRRINYLTGLTFPSKYSNGFMVPPLVKLTLGDIYNNQPGYINSLTYAIEEDDPWEIKPGYQVPHGINVSVDYSLIEKGIMRTHDFDPNLPTEGAENYIPFYAYGQDRAVSPHSNVGIPPSSPQT